MPEYTEFRLLRGTHRRRDGSRATAGDIVELTDRQTDQFNMDRFEPVEDVPDASGDIPDEWEPLRSMAAAYEGDEVNGQSAKAEIQSFFEELSDTEIAGLKERALGDDDDDEEDDEADEESAADSDDGSESAAADDEAEDA